MTSLTIQPRPGELAGFSRAESFERKPMAHLLGLGTAVPVHFESQEETQAKMAALWGLNASALERWRRIVAGSGITRRHGVLPVEQVIGLSTAQRMSVFERSAPELAAQAAIKALEASEMAAAAITDLIVVSCTGFSAPGVDVALVRMLGLPPTVRRTVVGFMGCFGAITGLRTAVGACAAHPSAVALVVCVELCSLHMRPDRDVQNQVASALFADGAAAAVVASAGWDGEPTSVDGSPFIGRLTTGAGLLLEQGRDWMTWRITDAGFAMTLTRDVPAALHDCLAEFVDGAYGKRPASFIIHPGGPGILDAADEALQLAGGRGLDASRAVLARFGNMSSATVLFVLEEALRLGHPLPALLLAFGPGLTIESLLLLP